VRESRPTVSDAPSHRRSAGAPAFDAPGLAAAAGGTLLLAGGRPIRGAAVDSRRISRGECFFALPGERTDGHEFLADAVAAGAAALVVTRPPDADRIATLATAAGGELTVIQVDDALAALHDAARWWRARFEPLVVGVTGSLAKTSTKEQVAEVMSERWTVLRSAGNENNEIGLPLTLLRLGPAHDVAVLEMGMYVLGEIATLAALARPRIGVVTAVRGTHLSRAGSLEAIERGKGELIEALPADGTAVLNADDPRVARMAARTRAGVLRYGFDEGADVTAEDVVSLGASGMRFTLRALGCRVAVTSPALGRHSVHNALAAAAVGLAAGMTHEQVAHGLGRDSSAPHRSVLLQAGEWRILDDSYNAAPDSVAAALDLLHTLPGRRVAVLGEMLELGDASLDAHREVGRRAAQVADRLVVVGDGAAGIAEGAGAAGMEEHRLVVTTDRDDALRHLLEILRPGDVVLVKASRGVALDVLVDGLVDVTGRDAALA
jgi:UDP-N-acetylmuramoyl-tripeptide--D-alanyl-D-alanine ligase